jgi:hypothetical protein
MAGHDDGHSFTLQSSDEELGDWTMVSELANETLEMTIRRLMGRAVQEQLDYSRSRERFPS